MTRRSVVAVVMSALMILSTSLPAYADTVVTEQSESETELFGTPDYYAPVLESMSVDKTEVAAGESFVVTLIVNDDLSGLDFGTKEIHIYVNILILYASSCRLSC